jgi:cytochrome c biogenesis protein CcmG, thiol:disulfide interchange protein DsbE
MHSVKIDRFLRGGICLLTVALVYVLYASIHEHVVVAGDRAPEFNITADNGRVVSLPGFGGKLLVLNFWATWCPPCVDETPSLSRFAAEYANKGVVVLGVSVDKDGAAYQKFLEKFRPTFLTARDQAIHEDYGTFIYPETYIIDANGRVLRKFAEEVAWNDPKITAYFNSLL